MRNSEQLTVNKRFIIDLKRFTAVTAVTVQALRRQGPGVIGSIQKHLETLNLYKVGSLKDEDSFVRWLDRQTDELKTKHKVKWGAARKALNLFLRACLYDRYLSVAFKLDRLEPWLEIPLDQVIAGQLRERTKKEKGNCSLPPWSGLSGLDHERSKQFQDFAKQSAAPQELSRVHLDVGLWVNNRKQ